MNLCRYCGNDVSGNQQEIRNNAVYHRECLRRYIPWCEDAVAKFERFLATSDIKNVLWIGINVKYLYGQKEKDINKREKRAAKINELLRIVSALRNSDSGYVLIHLVGLASDDNFTGAFDEFADVKLYSLINDGSLFDEVYKKQLLSAYGKRELGKYTDILVLYVEGAESLITTDFKTKCALDDCIIDTPELTVFNHLKKKRQFTQKHHDINVSIPEDMYQLQESRNIQFKGYYEAVNTVNHIVRHTFEKLKLAEYISAFAKNEHGGSYLMGLGESARSFAQEGYQSKTVSARPVSINNCVEVERLIKERVSEICLVCDYDGTRTSNEDLVKIYFIPPHSGSPEDNDRYIVHVSVRSVNGIVFYEKDGPEAYRVNTGHNSITRLTAAEWFQAFNQRLEN